MNPINDIFIRSSEIIRKVGLVESETEKLKKKVNA